MVAQNIRIEDYRWAAVKGGRIALRLYGANTSLTTDDADGESLAALAICPRTFDPVKGRFGCYCKQAAFNAVRKLCRKQEKEPAREVPQTLEANADRFGDWLREDRTRSAVLEALQDPEQALQILKRTRRVWLSVPQIAAKIKISERKARRLCEQAQIPAVQIDREWFALSREVTAWRGREIRKAYQFDGARRVAAMFGVNLRRVQAIVYDKPAKTISRREKPLDVVFFGAKKHGNRNQTA